MDAIKRFLWDYLGIFPNRRMKGLEVLEGFEELARTGKDWKGLAGLARLTGLARIDRIRRICRIEKDRERFAGLAGFAWLLGFAGLLGLAKVGSDWQD